MKISKNETIRNKKFGINLSIYKTGLNELGFVNIETKKGHMEEFYNKTSTFIYYILEGNGTFFLNGEPMPVKAYDLLIIPPNTKIYYLGNMRLNLITTPAWSEKDEVHVRDIEIDN